MAGRVIAVGGQTGKATLRTVEGFDLGSQAWHSLPQLGGERKYTAVCWGAWHGGCMAGGRSNACHVPAASCGPAGGCKLVSGTLAALGTHTTA